jgi:hypothetical protein
MRRGMVLAGLCLLIGIGNVVAQEHWSEGPVWACSAYRTKPGKSDDYLKYLRENFVPTTDEAKKQGLIIDRKVFVQTPREANDWDVMICSLFPSYGKAMDFNAADDSKWKAIQAKQLKTPDEDKQKEMTARRFEMREFIGTSYIREVALKPLT